MFEEKAVQKDILRERKHCALCGSEDFVSRLAIRVEDCTAWSIRKQIPIWEHSKCRKNKYGSKEPPLTDMPEIRLEWVGRGHGL